MERERLDIYHKIEKIINKYLLTARVFCFDWKARREYRFKKKNNDQKKNTD